MPCEGRSCDHGLHGCLVVGYSHSDGMMGMICWLPWPWPIGKVDADCAKTEDSVGPWVEVAEPLSMQLTPMQAIKDSKIPTL